VSDIDGLAAAPDRLAQRKQFRSFSNRPCVPGGVRHNPPASH
jgi:hypothetical protein